MPDYSWPLEVSLLLHHLFHVLSCLHSQSGSPFLVVGYLLVSTHCRNPVLPGFRGKGRGRGLGVLEREQEFV